MDGVKSIFTYSEFSLHANLKNPLQVFELFSVFISHNLNLIFLGD